jgi:hypothetical protein
MTLAQIAENPMTVATDEAISSFADSRQRRLAMPLRHPKDIRYRSRTLWMRPQPLLPA